MEIIDNVYCGGDKEFERVRTQPGWSFLRTAKEGPGGHRQTLGYHTLGAPKGPNYLWVRRRNLMALNILDIDDTDSDIKVPDEAIDKGLAFADERYRAGDKILIACNQGHSRGPSMCMMFLRTIGELPQSFHQAEKIFKTLYPKYDPGRGMRSALRRRWDDLKDKYVGRSSS